MAGRVMDEFWELDNKDARSVIATWVAGRYFEELAGAAGDAAKRAAIIRQVRMEQDAALGLYEQGLSAGYYPTEVEHGVVVCMRQHGRYPIEAVLERQAQRLHGNRTSQTRQRKLSEGCNELTPMQTVELIEQLRRETAETAAQEALPGLEG